MATQTITDKFIRVNGLRLHYLDWGNEGATPLVMLHGLRSYAHAWDPVAQALASKHHVIAVDQRGRGNSDWSPKAEYHTEAYVSDLEQLVDQLKLNKFILMGHSMGGANTIVYTSKHPDRVKAAVIEDMGPGGGAPSAGGNRIAQELESTPLEFPSWEAARAFWRKERPLISEEALNIRLQNTLKQLPNGKITWKYDIQGIQKARQNTNPARQIDLWPHTRNIQCPTLVLRGGISDILSRQTVEAMARANPKIRWVEVPNASHYVHDDNLDFFNIEVERFLAGLK